MNQMEYIRNMTEEQQQRELIKEGYSATYISFWDISLEEIERMLKNKQINSVNAGDILDRVYAIVAENDDEETEIKIRARNVKKEIRKIKRGEGNEKSIFPNRKLSSSSPTG